LPEQLLLLSVIGKVDPRELTPETGVELTVRFVRLYDRRLLFLKAQSVSKTRYKT
jgi:hypothetical protein